MGLPNQTHICMSRITDLTTLPTLRGQLAAPSDPSLLTSSILPHPLRRCLASVAQCTGGILLPPAPRGAVP